ncbi:hypothetical protein JAAARDRAFT_310452 [Jaapia argillacea MUCL 33604]|uniref:Nephrocystin 3-like N-terminal domain-containing protein n=1 Tax=Jaapia argillacea MUCL 33604 TaxID=933084 RepID=A0A067PNK7_9AGAM|nr:hypothetical protein JAAARDRAFT_310452 [Jaapia argillacea MUCL 33604]
MFVSRVTLAITSRMKEEVEELNDAVNLERLPRAFKAQYDHVDSPHCLENTRAGVLQEIQGWIDNKDAKGQMFWLSGEVGTGKTTIALTVAQILASNDKILSASFFCSSRLSAAERDMDMIFPTLAYLLAEHDRRFRLRFFEVVKSREFRGALLYEQLKRLIIDPLLSIQAEGRSQRPTFFVIDALDECDDRTTPKRILQALHQCIPLIPSLKVFISGRPIPSFEQTYKRDCDEVLYLHDVEPHIRNSDIRVFISNQLRQAAEIRKLPDSWPSSDYIEKLVKMAGGLFIFASTVCMYIQNYRGDPEYCLREVVDLSARPGGWRRVLDGLYKQVLRDAANELVDSRRALCRTVLGTIILLQTPLTIEDLCELRGLRAGDLRGLLMDFRPVLIVPERGDQPILAIHTSFRDFLMDQTRAPPECYICPERLHKEILVRLLGCMQALKPDICDIGRYKFDAEVQNLALRPAETISGLLAYACRHWADHLALVQYDAKQDSDLLQALDQFCGTKLLNWIETLSLLGDLRTCVSSLNKARAWHSKTVGTKLDYKDVMDDAYRAVLEFYPAVKECPAQTYFSFLLFSPTESLLRKLYPETISGGVHVLHGAERVWSRCLRTIDVPHEVHAVSISPNSEQILSRSYEGTLNLWDGPTGELKLRLGDEGDSGEKSHFAGFLSDQKLFGEMGRRWDQTMYVWCAETGLVERTVSHSAPSDYDDDIWLSRLELRRLISRSSNSMLCWPAILDLNIGEVKCELRDSELYSPETSTLSPDGKYAAIGTKYRGVIVWNAVTGDIHGIFTGPTGWVLSVSFSPDSQLVAASDNIIRVWEVASGNLITSLRGHAAQVNTVRFSLDGQYIVSGSNDKTIKFWRFERQQDFEPYAGGHSEWIECIDYAEDGSLVATGSWDGTILLWDPKTGLPRAPLGRSGCAVRQVYFVGQGQSLISMSTPHGGFTYVWDKWDLVSGTPQSLFRTSRRLRGLVPTMPLELGNHSNPREQPGMIYLEEVTMETSGNSEGSVEGRVARTHPIPIQQSRANTSEFRLHEGWVLNPQGRPLCWVPPVYRGKYAVHGRVMALGGGNGKVLFLGFD